VISGGNDSLVSGQKRPPKTEAPVCRKRTLNVRHHACSSSYIAWMALSGPVYKVAQRRYLPVKVMPTNSTKLISPLG
jgi:hypothetical protein